MVQFHCIPDRRGGECLRCERAQLEDELFEFAISPGHRLRFLSCYMNAVGRGEQVIPVEICRKSSSDNYDKFIAVLQSP